MCAKLNYHVRLAIFLSMVMIMQNIQEKADLLKTKINATKITKHMKKFAEVCLYNKCIIFIAAATNHVNTMM